MPNATRYPIPAAEIRAEIRVSNSRFIATAASAPSVDEAKAFIARMRAEFADATHHVYAFVVGYGATTTLGMSDDGEPTGTAGKPTLAVLRGSGLGDVAVVVTRYFGGTLLGTGGLVHAYSDAARAVLDIVPRAEKVERRELVIEVPYNYYENCKRLIVAHNGAVLDEDFAVDVTLTLQFAVDDLAPFRAALIDRTAAQATIVE